MDSEVYSFALKSTLTEIQNICPDVKNSFIFTEEGEIIAGDENTPEKTMVKVVDFFDSILEKADSIGGVEGITLESSKGRLNVSCVNNFFLVTVTSREADRNYVNTVTRVLVPTVLKLLEKISPATFKSNVPKTELEQEPLMSRNFEKTIEEPARESTMQEEKPPLQPEIKPEPVLPEPPVSQFIVENIGGLLVPTDTVRIDNDLLAQWQELYGDLRIEEVEVETFGGKATQCKVKPIKDSKHEGKGIIQMPDKIQNTLEIRKGELVRVKPVVQ